MGWLSELDWSPLASLSSARTYRDHWRLFVCQLAGGIATFGIWENRFPHVLGFLTLWCAIASGGTIGLLLPGTIWQLYDKQRRVVTNGRLMIFAFAAGLLLLAVSLLLVAPDLQAEEEQRSMLRSLSPTSVAVIAIELGDSRDDVYKTEDAGVLAAFVKSSHAAELFYPSHESSLREFRIKLSMRDGSLLEYQARIPERHPQDVALRFRAYFSLVEIILPGLRPWLDEMTQGRADMRPTGPRLTKSEGAVHDFRRGAKVVDDSPLPVEH